MLVVSAVNGSSCGRYIAIEILQHFLAVCDWGIPQRLSFRCYIESVKLNSMVSPSRKIREMSCKPSHGARFGMRTPLPLLIGQPLQHTARGAHFLIEFRKQLLGNGHRLTGFIAAWARAVLEQFC